MIQPANAIAPPNYTQIPNVIFDYWMSRLNPGTFKILICMCRKIFGWHKSSDTISKNQLMKVCGMSKNSVQSAIEELEKCGLILKFQHQNEYGHQPNTYCLNIQKPLDEIYQESVRGDQNLGGGGSKNDLGVGQNLTGGVGQNLTPQKKDSTKERLTKEITTSPTPKIEKVESSASEVAIAPEKRIEPPPKSKKITSDFCPGIKELAEKMASALHEANTDWLVPKNLHPMMTQIEEMITKEGRNPKKILDVFMWAVGDHFWMDKLCKPNPAKYLRDNFAALAGKMNAKAPTNPNKVDRRLKDKDGRAVDDYKDLMF